MKKSHRLLLVAAAFICTQCTWHENAVLTSKIDFDEESIKLMKDLEPQIRGSWKIHRVQFKYQSYNQNQKKLGITKDTAYLDLATLYLEPASVPRTSPKDLRRGEYEGTITYQRKTYPIKFDLLPNYEWLAKRTGPQAFFLLQYNFKEGSRLVEPEEAFLEDIGLMTDNFSLKTNSGQPKNMVWKGLNRGIEEIELMKQ